MNFSLEIGLKTDLSKLPNIQDIYITLLQGDHYKDVAHKAKELVELGKNPVPHFPARAIKNKNELKEYVIMCKDFGVKQALVIGGGAQPAGDFHCSLQLFETGLLKDFKIGIAGHPEGSPDISDSDLEKAMIDKKPYADYIVTQWLMETSPIIDYVSKQKIYLIKEGDNFSKIASSFNISLRALMKANNQLDPRLLRIGQKIVIPGQ